MAASRSILKLTVASLFLAGPFLMPARGYADTAPLYIPSPSPAPEVAPPGRGPSETVRSRKREDFDPEGIKLGGFRAYPSLVTSQVYDSNIFRSGSGTRSDMISVIRPRFQLKSEFPVHRLDLTAEGAAGFFWEHDSENFLDYRGDARGHVDILRGLRLEAALSGEHGHEDRGSVDFGAGTEPVRFDRAAAVAVLAARTGSFRHRLGFGYTNTDYQDVGAVGGGVVNHDDRDHTRYDVFGRISYDAAPSIRIFASGAYQTTDFTAARDDAGLDRDSQGMLVAAGAEYDSGGLWHARLSAGWLHRSYADAALSDVSGPNVRGNVTANISPLTTLSAEISRDTVDTATPGASSYWDNALKVRADHELLRNLIVSVGARGRWHEFRGVDRTDWHAGAGLALRWLLSRNVWLSASADFDQRRSTGIVQAEDFQRSRLLMRLVLQP